MGTFFQQNFYFFCKVGIYFEENSVLSNKMEPIYKKFSVFYSTKLLHLHIPFLYISCQKVGCWCVGVLNKQVTQL